MKIVIDGTINVSLGDYKGKNFLPYVYEKRGGEVVPSFFVEDDKTFRFPRNWNKFITSSKMRVKDLEIIDNRVEVPLKNLLPLKDSFKLREYQETPVNDVLKDLRNKNKMYSTVLEAETGFGKTYILPQIVANLHQRTIILVDRNLLAKQMFDEFTDNTDGDIKMLSSKNPELGDVNIATFQMFLKNPKLLKKLSRSFGLVIVDECHTAPAAQFAKVLAGFSAKHRLGLSATPTRSDGLTEIISDLFGYSRVIGENPDKMQVNLVAVETGVPVNFADKSEFAQKFGEAATTPEILMMVEDSVKHFHKKGRKIMLYATYKVVQDQLKILVESLGLTVAVINSKVTHKVRDQIIKDFNAGKIDILVSGVILSKGISIHQLDTIVNLSTQNKESLKQTIGRLRREHWDKQTPLWVDFCFTGKLRRNTEDRVHLLYAMQDIGDKFFKYNKFEYIQMIEGRM